jgi:mono/diheme cytochrome c family protein
MSGWRWAIPILMAVTGFLAMPQEKTRAGNGSSSSKTSDLSAEKMYIINCASCHGIDGKGSGPAAVGLKKAAPDLTQISKRNNGQFPAAHVTRTIVGYESEAVHGSHDMPIWGVYFRPAELVALTEYIRSFQQR